MENRLVTKLVILYSMPKSPPEFVVWFRDRSEGRGWSGVREMDRGIGISHPLVSEILDGQQPSFDTCLKIADVFSVPRETVVFMAGLLPKPPGRSPELDEWNFLFDKLSDMDQEDLLTLARVKASGERVTRRKRAEEWHRLYFELTDSDRMIVRSMSQVADRH